MSLLFEATPDGAGRYLDWIISGLAWTLCLALGAWTIALVVGTLVGVIRTFPDGILPRIGRVYVETFRNIPLLVQMFFWYFVLPELLPARIGMAIKQMDPPWGSFVPALICLGLFTAARIAEQVRAGLQALPKGQAQAANALGFDASGMYRLILLPQAFRIILPTLTNEFMTIFKNTSVALTIGLVELTATAREINENTFRTFEAFGVVTIIYLLIALIAWQVMHRIEQAARLPGIASGKA
ncbi:MAG: amino acid ABC transporter permease [Alphaproteobacteria bacterium]|nr:MAG: amino acid ABC transporter permease [Alphaproteobacteria bacterium]TMK48423.1 MAG: amino acid ABC transporter permease [Alphaproteobacteria bacterium]